LKKKNLFAFSESLKSKKDVATTQSSSKLKDVETKLQQTESDNKVLSNKIATLEDKLSKQEANVSTFY
jgi:septal ring factor EnvC (AmiA/AmiB activator)